eukprot:450575_1
MIKKEEWNILNHKQIECFDNKYSVEVTNNLLFDKLYHFQVDVDIKNPINVIINSNISKFKIKSEDKIVFSKEEEISLKINSHKGHYSGNGPERLLKSDDNYYLSLYNQITNDWIIFDINNNGNNNIYYYPTKLQVRAIG